MLPAGDAELVRIVDAALRDATRRAGHWLACRPGCNQCCTGVFRISQLDAERLRQGLRLMSVTDAFGAALLQRRILDAQRDLRRSFPGDPATGVLYDDEVSQEEFENFANDAVCPVLDPASGTCALYAHRPMTCRTFGPPVRTDDGNLGTCELCFQGASEAEVLSAELHLPSMEQEETLTGKLPRGGSTIVAFAFDQLLI